MGRALSEVFVAEFLRTRAFTFEGVVFRPRTVHDVEMLRGFVERVDGKRRTRRKGRWFS